MKKTLRIALLCCALGLSGCQAEPGTDPKPSSTAVASSRLLKEKSPYLHQHADNAVDWYAWGDEAFERAKAENKPIFLSIGYSTCHWCHVMEEESFMDPKIGDYLKKHFISIKVDRETRPDVDAIYMNFVQRTTGSGGWPLTVFLTPEGVPIHGGTYFPNPPRYGKLGFLELLEKVSEVWAKDRENIIKEATSFSDKLAVESNRPGSDKLPPEAVLQGAVENWSKRFDAERGGFLPAPKFPSPPDLEFLLRFGVIEKSDRARTMALKTLDSIALGGINDHLDGGFHRYSTDAEWLVPHFEKMLYDQGQLVELFSFAYSLEENPLYRAAVESTLDYLNRRMKSPEGAFYSAEDADSTIPGTDKHAEGAFYVWSLQELKANLTVSEFEIATEVLGATEAGNASGDVQGELDGKNVLHLQKFDNSTELQVVLGKLDGLRDRRPRPLRDDKILTEWNAMLASGLIAAGRYLGKPEYLEQAREVLKFIEEKMVVDGILQRSFLEGTAEVPAFAADHAQLVKAYLSLFEATGEATALERAIHWQSVLDEHFWDSENFGYFETRDQGDLLYRKKGQFDGAVLSANSCAVQNLYALHTITGNGLYAERQEQSLKSLGKILERAPTSAPGALSSLLSYFGKHRTLIVVSLDPTWQRKLSLRYRPDLMLIKVTSAEQRESLSKLIPYLPPWSEKSKGYFCEDFSCGLPLESLAEVEGKL